MYSTANVEAIYVTYSLSGISIPKIIHDAPLLFYLLQRNKAATKEFYTINGLWLATQKGRKDECP